MIDPTTQRAEEIREETGMAWERACLQAERERDMHPAEVCGGTGNHDGQPVDSCDECAEHGPWEAEGA